MTEKQKRIKAQAIFEERKKIFADKLGRIAVRIALGYSIPNSFGPEI